MSGNHIFDKLCDLEMNMIEIQDDMRELKINLMKTQQMVVQAMVCLKKSFDMLTTGTLNLREELIDEIEDVRISMS